MEPDINIKVRTVTGKYSNPDKSLLNY